jgi:hypothetical protein
VTAELKRLGRTAEDLKSRRKGDVKKVRISQRLRSETTMSLKWIAGELRMGTWTQASNVLSKQGKRSR